MMRYGMGQVDTPIEQAALEAEIEEMIEIDLAEVGAQRHAEMNAILRAQRPGIGVGVLSGSLLLGAGGVLAGAGVVYYLVKRWRSR